MHGTGYCQIAPPRAKRLLRRAGKISFLLPALALAMAGCTAKKPTKDIVAKVNGVEITTTQLAAEAAAVRVNPADLTPQMREGLVQRIIDRELLVQSARTQKLDRNPNVLARKVLMEQSLLAQLALERVVDPTPDISDKQVSDYIAANPLKFAGAQALDTDVISFAVGAADPTNIAPARDLTTVGAKLRYLGARFDRAKQTINSATLPPALVEAMIKTRDQPVYFVNGDKVYYVMLLDHRPAPAPPAVQQATARSTLAQQKVAGQIAAETQRLRKKARIVYQKGYAPADKPAPGK